MNLKQNNNYVIKYKELSINMKGIHKTPLSLNWITHHLHSIQRPVGNSGWYLELISCTLDSDN